MHTTLVVSGGSTKGLAIVGALLYLSSKINLDDFNAYFCTSAGAIICLLMAVGFTPLELVVAFERLPIIVSPCLDSKNPSFFNYDNIISYISNLVVSKVGRPLTFRDLYERYGKELYMVTYNYSRDVTEILSWKTHPDMNCVQGVRLSCAMAFLFEQCVYEGDVYVDGAFGNNFPLDIACEYGYLSIVGINLAAHPSRTREDELFKKMSELFFIPMTAYTNMVLKLYASKCSALIQICCDLPAYELELDLRGILRLLSAGYKAALEQYK